MSKLGRGGTKSADAGGARDHGEKVGRENEMLQEPDDAKSGG